MFLIHYLRIYTYILEESGERFDHSDIHMNSVIGINTGEAVLREPSSLNNRVRRRHKFL